MMGTRGGTVVTTFKIGTNVDRICKCSFWFVLCREISITIIEFDREWGNNVEFNKINR